MNRRYSLVEALITEGAFEDRIQQQRMRSTSLLDADPATIPPKDRNEYARTSAILAFLDDMQSPQFPAAAKNIGYLNWGIARIKDCADAEINTIAEEVSQLIQAHLTLKGTGQISPAIDDYTTLGALRGAIEGAALSRQSKSFEAEGKKAGREMLDAAIRMSDVLYLDGSIVADEDGNKSLSPETQLAVLAPKTRVASQVIGNPRTFGINTLGGPVRWCTSATQYGNQYCNYTVNSNVFLIYVIDLTKPDNDRNQKVAFVFTPVRTSQGAWTGTASSEVVVDGKRFQFQTFNNLDASGPAVTDSAKNSLGESTFNMLMELMKEYISSQGGVPHLSKKAEELASGVSSTEFIQSVASSELPAGYGVEALYDTMISKDFTGSQLQIPAAMKQLLTKDKIDKRSAVRIITMLVGGTTYGYDISNVAKHFLENVEDVRTTAEAIMIVASSADNPSKVSGCMKMMNVLAARSDVDPESEQIINEAQSKVDLLLAQAIGRLEPDAIVNYKDQISKTRYPMAIVGTFVPAATRYLQDPKNVRVESVEKLLRIIDAILQSPGAQGNRQLPLKMLPLNAIVVQSVTRQILSLIQKKAFKSAKSIASFMMSTGLQDRPELQKFAGPLMRSVELAEDRFSRNEVIKKSSDENEVIELINDPDMTRYLDVFSNRSLTENMISAAYDRASAEGEGSVSDFLLSVISNVNFMTGDQVLLDFANRAIDQLGERNTAVDAARSVMDSMGLISESHHRGFRSHQITRKRQRYSLARTLLGR